MLGAYEGLRGYHLLPEGGQDKIDNRQSAIANGSPALPEISEIAGLTHAAELSQVPLLPEELLAQTGTCSRKGGSTRTCSRWICATAIPGG